MEQQPEILEWNGFKRNVCSWQMGHYTESTTTSEPSDGCVSEGCVAKHGAVAPIAPALYCSSVILRCLEGKNLITVICLTSAFYSPL